MLSLLVLVHLHALANDEPVVEWLKSSAIPLKTVHPGNGFGDLEPFGKSLKGVRIVGMGEPTHGTREAFLFKHRMFEYLVERNGYRVFGIEASFPDCLPIERYIQTGEGDLESVVHGQGFWVWDTEEVLGLVYWMREFNRTHVNKVHFVGFDMQAKASGFAKGLEYLKKWKSKESEKLDNTKITLANIEALRSFLLSHKSELIAKSGLEAFVIARQCIEVSVQASKDDDSKMSEAKYQALIKADTQARNDLNLLRSAGWEAKGVQELLGKVDDGSASFEDIQHAKAIVRSKLSVVPAGSEANAKDLLANLDSIGIQIANIAAWSGWRDKCMAENVSWIVDKLYPRSKAMLWAHNYHVGTSVPGENSNDTMGRYLTRRFGKTYFPVGQCFGEGSFQSRLETRTAPVGKVQSFEVGPPKRGSFDEVFGKGGSLFLAVFDRAPTKVRRWLEQRQATRTAGSTYDSTSPDDAYRNDSPAKWYRAMVYLGKTTRSRPLRLTRERFGIQKDW